MTPKCSTRRSTLSRYGPRRRCRCRARALSRRRSLHSRSATTSPSARASPSLARSPAAAHTLTSWTRTRTSSCRMYRHPMDSRPMLLRPLLLFESTIRSLLTVTAHIRQLHRAPPPRRSIPLILLVSRRALVTPTPTPTAFFILPISCPRALRTRLRSHRPQRAQLPHCSSSFRSLLRRIVQHAGVRTGTCIWAALGVTRRSRALAVMRAARVGRDASTRVQFTSTSELPEAEATRRARALPVDRNGTARGIRLRKLLPIRLAGIHFLRARVPRSGTFPLRVPVSTSPTCRISVALTGSVHTAPSLSHRSTRSMRGSIAAAPLDRTRADTAVVKSATAAARVAVLVPALLNEAAVSFIWHTDDGIIERTASRPRGGRLHLYLCCTLTPLKTARATVRDASRTTCFSISRCVATGFMAVFLAGMARAPSISAKTHRHRMSRLALSLTRSPADTLQQVTTSNELIPLLTRTRDRRDRALLRTRATSTATVADAFSFL